MTRRRTRRTRRELGRGREEGLKRARKMANSFSVEDYLGLRGG